MASRWSSFPAFPRSQSRASAPDSPLPSRRGRGVGSIDNVSTHTSLPWTELPALEEPCAKYILSVMALFLRQTASANVDATFLLARPFADVSFRDYEALDVPDNGGMGRFNTEVRGAATAGSSSASIHGGPTGVAGGYERTHMSATKSMSNVNELIAKFTGKIVFSLSASNWDVVWSRLRGKITMLADEGAEAEKADLLILSYSVLDKQRLIQVLHGESHFLLYLLK
jgi:hypothetical protein